MYEQILGLPLDNALDLIRKDSTLCNSFIRVCHTNTAARINSDENSLYTPRVVKFDGCYLYVSFFSYPPPEE